jgi:hypothetical protein
MTVKNRRDATEVFKDVTGDKRFFCRDGCISKNLAELSDCFSRMTQDVFDHHVTNEKIDFSKWVNEVLGDTKLANDLLHVKSPAEAEKVTKARVFWLRKK